MARIRKAILAGLAAGAAALGTAMQDGRVDQAELVTIVVAIVVAGAAVWAVPNKTEPPSGS